MLETKTVDIPSSEQEQKIKVLNRLRRLEGQVRGLHKMVAEERSCHEVLTLLSGIRSALDATADVMLEHYLDACQRGLQTGEIEVDELVRAVKLARG